MKTNNYLGKQSENRGIILFFIIFAIVAVIIGGITISNSIEKKKENEGITSIDQMKEMLEKDMCDVERFEVAGNRLVLAGALIDAVDGYMLTKIDSVQIVLKDKDGDKYIYDTYYFISDDKIDFSSIKKGNEISEIDLDAIEKGEYYAFLRLKYESSKSEDRYAYKYYTFKTENEIKALDYNTVKMSFGASKKVSNYLTIVNE